MLNVVAQHLVGMHGQGPPYLAICADSDTKTIEIIFPTNPTPTGLLCDPMHNFLPRLKDLSESPCLSKEDFLIYIMKHLKASEMRPLQLFLVTLTTSQVKEDEFHSAIDDNEAFNSCSEESALEMVEEEIKDTNSTDEMVEKENILPIVRVEMKSPEELEMERLIERVRGFEGFHWRKDDYRDPEAAQGGGF